jgi:hypothetical protein
MTEDFSFQYTMPGDQVLTVDCSVIKGRTAIAPNNIRPGEPAEDDQITIESVGLIVEPDDGFWADFNTEGLYVSTRTASTGAKNKVPAKFKSLDEAILDAAHDAWADTEAAA